MGRLKKKPVEDQFPQLIKMYKKMSLEDREKGLDTLIANRLITKTQKKEIILECLKNN